MSNEDLRAKAEKLDDAVARMSARQFNATYPLQVKRKLAPPTRRGGRKSSKATKRRGRKAGSKRADTGGATAERKRGRPRGRAAAQAGGASIRGAGGRGPGAAATNGARGRVRAALLDFARDLASADGAGLVDVIAGVDGYVDRVMKASGARG
jgi:hypothetical protein